MQIFWLFVVFLAPWRNKDVFRGFYSQIWYNLMVQTPTEEEGTDIYLSSFYGDGGQTAHFKNSKTCHHQISTSERQSKMVKKQSTLHFREMFLIVFLTKHIKWVPLCSFINPSLVSLNGAIIIFQSKATAKGSSGVKNGCVAEKLCITEKSLDQKWIIKSLKPNLLRIFSYSNDYLWTWHCWVCTSWPIIL